MFLSTIKFFLLKKSLKKQLSNVKQESLNCPIATVGLIVDDSIFFETSELKKEIILNKIASDTIKIIVYCDALKTKQVYSHPTFDSKVLNYRGEFNQKEINDFISDEFDLLISYYTVEKPFLLLLTHKSKAKFKVGFSTIDKRLNHLLINIAVENYKGFVQELFRYLKILNKI